MTASYPRRSPLSDLAVADISTAGPVWLRDTSLLPRFGCKGPGAAAWLASSGLEVATPANVAIRDGQGVLVARLGSSEFLVEGPADAAERLQALAARLPAPGVYPVIRQDAAFVLGGAQAIDVLRQTCSVRFAADTAGTVVMTTMTGVAVTVVPSHRDGTLEFAVWCDPSFGAYLWSTLAAIARETGGRTAQERRNQHMPTGDT